MAKRRTNGLLALCVGAWLAAACWAPDAWAQARSSLRRIAPGILSTLGATGMSHDFNRYSYGIGSLGSTGGSPSGVLSRSLSRGGFSLRSSSGRGLSSSMSSNIGSGRSGGIARSGLSGTGASNIATPIRTGLQLYKPARQNMVLGAAGKSKSLDPSVFAALGAAEGYLNSLGAPSGNTLAKTTQSITSFVPAEKSVFASYIASGEKALLAGDTGEAFNNFQLASHIASRAPETLLSMAHTRIATSGYSYFAASRYLKEALKYFPELPLTSLNPKGFYAKNAYVMHLIRLEEYLERHPYDGDASLCLAYLRWFDGDVAATEAALSKALGAGNEARDAGMIEAANTFWDGCVASGKVTGKLKPTTRPAAKPLPRVTTESQPPPHRPGR